MPGLPKSTIMHCCGVLMEELTEEPRVGYFWVLQVCCLVLGMAYGAHGRTSDWKLATLITLLPILGGVFQSVNECPHSTCQPFICRMTHQSDITFSCGLKLLNVGIVVAFDE